MDVKVTDSKDEPMPLFATTPVEELETPYPRRWWALLVLCLSLLIIVMANTSLIVAAPDMTRDLRLSSSDLEWVIDGYTVPYAALMLLLGAVGDKYSRRGALILGLAVFAGGSVAGSLVHSAHAVIAARAVMGLGAAMIMPATLSLLVATFPKGERVKAITAWSATSGLGIALGPVLAGSLLRHYAWGSTFLINVPIAAGALLASLFLVPPSKAKDMGKLDFVGGLLSVVTMGSLVYAIIEGFHSGWHAGPVTSAVVAGVGMAAFIAWELRHPAPILNVRKFADRALSGSVLAVLFFFFGAFGAVYYSTQHLQFVLGYDPLQTGVRLLPLAGGVFLGAALTAQLTPRIGMKPVIVLGMLLGSGSILMLARIGDGSTYSAFVPTLALLGLAIGLSLSPCTDAIMGSFPEAELGVGGGINDTAVEFGASLGIALLGSILASSYKSTLGSMISGHLPTQALDTAKDSIGGAQAVAQQVAQSPQGGPQQAHLLVAAADHAFTHAVAHTSLIGGIILAVGTIVVALILPGRNAPAGRHTATSGPESAVEVTERVAATVGEGSPATEVVAIGAAERDGA